MTIIKTSFEDLPVTVVNAFGSDNSNFFTSFGWFENFVETVAKHMNVDVFVFYEDSVSPPTILPVMFMVDHSMRMIKSLSNYYSPIFSVLNNKIFLNEENDDDFFKKLKEHLNGWDAIELRPLSLEESILIHNQFKRAGIPAISFFCFGNWYLDVAGQSFKQYFSGLPSRLVNTVSRKSKKFFVTEGARIEIITSEQGLTDGLACYLDVYNASWKVAEPYKEFIPGLMRLAASIGGLRLGVAYLGDKPIASQFWIVTGGTAFIYKLAYDEDYKQYSAGTLLTTKLLEYVIDVDKVSTVDYLCGDDDYKRDWMRNRRERYGIMAFNVSSLRGGFMYVKEMTKKFVKRILKYSNYSYIGKHVNY